MIGMSVHCSVLTTVTNRTALIVPATNESEKNSNTNIGMSDDSQKLASSRKLGSETHNYMSRDSKDESQKREMVRIKKDDSIIEKDNLKLQLKLNAQLITPQGLLSAIKCPSVCVLELKGLTEEDVRELLILYIGESNVSDRLVKLVKDVSSGNAFWCKSIANFIIENGMEDLMLDGIKNQNNLENSLQFLMFCRLDRFTSLQQLVAKTASIVGFEFSFSVLFSVMKSTGNILSSLETLQEHGFIYLKSKLKDDFIFCFQNEEIYRMLYEVTPKR